MYTIEKFAQSDQLPTLPEVATRLLEVAQQECPDFKEVSQIIRSDPVVSGKILKTVNSALFGFSPKIESIEHALPKLGVTLLRTLVLSFHLSNHETHQSELEPVLQRHWRSSLTQAVFAELIAEEIGRDKVDPSTCFLAAMMQDIGILAMISEAPADYLENVLDRCEFPNVIAGERNHFGFSHTDVSVAIVENLGMEASFVDAIRHHHDHVNVQETTNGKSSPSLNSRLKTVLQAASLGANVLASSRNSSLSLDSSLDQWVDFISFNFGFSGEQAEDLISDVNKRVEQYSVVFNFNIGENVQANRVVHKAKILLQEIALKNQMNLLSNTTGEDVSAKPAKAKKELPPEKNELYLDSLSGLLNRRYMSKFLNEKIAYWVKKRKPIALMFMDVDKFKTINDTYGHSVGDRAIQHVANWLKEAIRKGDIAIRIGGDEYIVVLQSVTKKDFESAANRVANEIPMMKVEDEDVRVGLSIGCAFYQPIKGDVADVNWLIEQADQAMYRAKKSGGGSVACEMFIGTDAVGVGK
jgi:diguanylate cyclase (GGDEF)-like protein